MLGLKFPPKGPRPNPSPPRVVTWVFLSNNTHPLIVIFFLTANVILTPIILNSLFSRFELETSTLRDMCLYQMSYSTQ
ncbi:hypothetical protein HanLR1_Chr12g0442421 [Helianthus annuus]|nr:hypothetical protein HanLR1_Chr12g0442421 [Helianthus annuus]